MNPAARSIYVFSIYLFANALVFLAAPDLALKTLGLPATEEVWIRCLGIVIGVMGYYHLQAARHGLTAFFRATVPGRVFVLCALTALVLLDQAAPTLLFFGVFDVAAALWTASALRAARLHTGVAAR